MSRLFAALLAIALAASPAFAQAKPGQAKPAPQKADKTASQDKGAVQKARTQPDEGQPVNTRIELTITDTRGEGAPITKTVSILTADRSWGRIRTQGDVQIQGAGGGRFPVILNVDARPTLVRDNRAKVELTIEYRPADEIIVPNGGNPTAVPSSRRDPQGITPNINESLAVVLEDGKPMVISQSADPVTDRKVKVEAKMTILR